MNNFSTMPLRFRVWDKGQKRFTNMLNSSRRYLDTCLQYYAPEILCFEEKDRYVISQDTGLKDKNGKSIYTGDIISRFAENAPAVVKYAVGEVGTALRGEIVADRLDGAGELYLTWECDTEIIGNIWQNPELLEG